MILIIGLAIMSLYNDGVIVSAERKELFMKGRVQAKSGYFYVVIIPEKGSTPVWRATGILSGEKGSRAYNKNKRLAEEKIKGVIEQYEKEMCVGSESLWEEPQTAGAVKSAINDTARSYRLARPQIGKDIAFEQAVDLYLKSATGLKGNTAEKYSYAAKHIKAWFGARMLFVSEINALDVAEYFRYKTLGLNDDGSIPSDEKTQKKQSLGKATLKDHKCVLNQVWEFCTSSLKIVDVSNNPIRAAKIGKVPLHSKYLTAEQAIKLVKALIEDDERIELIAAVALALFYGMRRQEVLGCNWPSIDMKRDTVLICRTATRIGKDVVYEDTTKTEASYRTMPLFSFVKRILLKLYSRQKLNAAAMEKGYHKNSYVIKWDDGHLMRPDYLTTRFGEIMSKYSERLGIPKITFHQLRHSTASLLAANGHTAQEIALWLGQSSVRSAERYTHLQVQSTKHKMTSTIDQALMALEASIQTLETA